ncbi:hypothetical protein KEM56_006949, partial [Ascosphaera pollenicola]
VPLPALLEGDFFNQYIKTGNILMVSEGRPGVNSIYTLSDGILRLELDKSIYEKVGIVGKAVKHGGRTHIKERYLIEINLRLPSMLHGKNGFEKIVHAFKTVLNEPVTWLFCDLDPKADYSDKAPQSADKHATEALSSEFLRQTTDELSEWLALVALDSDRVRSDDTIDPYLSRYALPADKDECKEGHLLCLSWKGLVPAEWITRVFVSLSRHVHSPNSPSESWFALTASAFLKKAMDNDKGYTILVLPEGEELQETEQEKQIGRRYLLWEYGGGMGFF